MPRRPFHVSDLLPHCLPHLSQWQLQLPSWAGQDLEVPAPFSLAFHIQFIGSSCWLSLKYAQAPSSPSKGTLKSVMSRLVLEVPLGLPVQAHGGLW